MQTKEQKQKSEQGFTLVELLVTMFIFVLIGGAVVNLAISGISGQRQALATQEGISQASFLAEYMSRALREAEKDLGPTCVSQRGLNYEVFDDSSPPDGKNERIRFLDERDKCREFLLDLSSNQVKEKISSDNTEANLGTGELLIADNLTIVDFIFNVEGAPQTDNKQPRVTFLLQMQAGALPEKRIRLQTTISQRIFDIQEE